MENIYSDVSIKNLVYSFFDASTSYEKQIALGNLEYDVCCFCFKEYKKEYEHKVYEIVHNLIEYYK